MDCVTTYVILFYVDMIFSGALAFLLAIALLTSRKEKD